MKEDCMTYTVRIEQTDAYPMRMKYIAKSDCFIEKTVESLGHARGVRQPYGWMVASGTPPEPHLDVIVMTDTLYALGERVQVRVIGVFRRNDGDHKLVGVPVERDIDDFAALTEEEKADMHRLYPREDPGEGWFGREVAEGIIKDFFAKKEEGRL